MSGRSARFSPHAVHRALPLRRLAIVARTVLVLVFLAGHHIGPGEPAVEDPSAQRLLQNGRNLSTTGLRQIGQEAVRGLSARSDMFSIW